LKARTNPLLKYFRPSNLISFHQSLGIGELHAIREGIITNAISYVINLIRAVAYHDKPHYQSNTRLLNKRIAYFPEQFTLVPCRMVKFKKGLQGILKEKKKSRKIKFCDGNVLLGSFEGWKRPCLLFKILFSIGCDNSIIPTGKKWFRDILIMNSRKKGRFSHVPVFNSLSIDLHRIAMNTLLSVWEVHMFCQVKSFTDSDLNTFQMVIRNSRYHMSRIHCILLHLDGKVFAYEKNIKFHNLEHHFCDQIRELGFDSRLDEEMGEAAHKTFVHDPFKLSSRRKDIDIMEIAKHIKRMQLADCMEELLKQKQTTTDSSLSTVNLSYYGSRLSILFNIDTNNVCNSTLQLYSFKEKRLLSNNEIESSLHPELTQKKLFDKLFEHWRKDNLYVQCMHQILAAKCFCTLRTYLRIVNTRGTIVLRANPRQVRNLNIRKSLQETSGVFSFVRVTHGSSSFLCQVMAIVVIEKTDVQHNFFVVQQMEECVRQPSLPFEQYTYQRNKNKQIYVVESENIHPACVLSIFRLADTLQISTNFIEIPENRFSKKLPMSYEQLQYFNNDQQLYRAFEDDHVINNWALQRDIEVSRRQNGGKSTSVLKTKTKIQKLRNSTKRQRIQEGKRHADEGDDYEAATYDDDDCVNDDDNQEQYDDGVEEQDDDCTHDDDDDDDDDDVDDA